MMRNYGWAGAPIQQTAATSLRLIADIDGVSPSGYRRPMRAPPNDAIAETLVRVREALAALAPLELALDDDSGLHAGHGGHRPGRLTHLRVRIVSEAFRGRNRLARHRLVNDLLAGEIAAGLHALAIEARAPGE